MVALYSFARMHKACKVHAWLVQALCKLDKLDRKACQRKCPTPCLHAMWVIPGARVRLYPVQANFCYDETFLKLAGKMGRRA